MPTPTAHALLSASSSHRWLECTAAPLYERTFPEGEPSVYAREGTLAHEICELYGKHRFGHLTKTALNRRLKQLQQDELYKPEMLETAETYTNYLVACSIAYLHTPVIQQEDLVDLTDYIPEGFGTCDCVMIGDDTIRIIDYKHGKGVKVSAKDNSQMRLYALGALAKYYPLYGDTIKRVITAIVQPRISDEVEEEELTVEELLAWGERIKPIAQEAFNGPGTFKAGEWCKFCAGRAVCRKRAEYYTALEPYADQVPEGSLTPEQKLEQDKAMLLAGEPEQARLTDDEVGDLLKRGAKLQEWLDDLREYATQAILDGRTVAGWKVVEGRSTRAFRDYGSVIDVATRDCGLSVNDLYERKELTPAKVEALIGKKEFKERLSEYVVTPAGKPTLAVMSDKRPDFNPAAIDAAGLQ